MSTSVRSWRALAALCAIGYAPAAFAQTSPPVILQIDLENWVQYFDDVTDPTKLASVPNQTPATGLTFMQNVWVADIVAVNGRPARGTYVNRTQSFGFRPAPAAGQNVADVNRNGGPTAEAYEILQTDGTPIGAIMVMGLVAGTPPPGSPVAQTSCNRTIVGGTGAFLGVRGQSGVVSSANVRNASQSEDPSLRRVLGGGKMRTVLYVIPMYRPEIAVTPTGPAVVHSSDFTLVTPAKPARAGEILTIFARGLGPTGAKIDPGAPFPADPLANVNGPVEVTVNGASVEALGAVGYPGTTDAYQVNFRVPADAAKGTASLQLSVAWISSAPVSFALQ